MLSEEANTHMLCRTMPPRQRDTHKHMMHPRTTYTAPLFEPGTLYAIPRDEAAAAAHNHAHACTRKLMSRHPLLYAPSLDDVPTTADIHTLAPCSPVPCPPPNCYPPPAALEFWLAAFLPAPLFPNPPLIPPPSELPLRARTVCARPPRVFIPVCWLYPVCACCPSVASHPAPCAALSPPSGRLC